ncbi:glycoside hydrolase family 16 [Lecanosticta acicola]|uniref:endo-1,3(4)-beta-glucanase n=1 Tax=Lecanosticta acicola TaxID=111012 RepID=A0AAI8Z3S4_9PEZI|nr:glycoside hydrolase family 16 [Lecanosticta acicola]
MHFSTLLNTGIAITLFSTSGRAGYVLQDDYFSGNFFDNFDFFDSPDPTHGFVEYQSQNDASSAGLISSSSNNAKMLVDSSNVTPDGRPSVRLTSKKSYSSGLVVLDVDHMPGGICGTWPAFWTVGPNWPLGGEIDIIEGVNEQTQNDMTLHTGPGCAVSNTGLFSGVLKTLTCDSSAGNNQGCQIADGNPGGYGAAFNAHGGGVYAMEWTPSAISVYFFPRASIPADALGASPNPSTWGTPVAQFSGGCDFASAFTDQQLVFDTTFCGDWAGSPDVWSSSSCSQQASSCTDFVANHPSAFQDAYWSINALKVYSTGGGGASEASSPSPTSAAVSTAAPASVSTSEPSPSSPSESGSSGSGVVPWVGPDGTVNWGEESTAAATPTPTPTGGSGWYNSPGGFAQWGGKKRDEEDVLTAELLKERAAKHLRIHKRHGSGRL